MIARSSQGRLIRKLRDTLGEVICLALEIMLNPDGRLFVQTTGASPSDGEDGNHPICQATS